MYIITFFANCFHQYKEIVMKFELVLVGSRHLDFPSSDGSTKTSFWTNFWIGPNSGSGVILDRGTNYLKMARAVCINESPL